VTQFAVELDAMTRDLREMREETQTAFILIVGRLPRMSRPADKAASLSMLDAVDAEREEMQPCPIRK
jgi:hypothetical protein